MPYLKRTPAGEATKVPDAEYEVLTVLVSMGEEAHGPAIARASKGAVPVGSVYKLLSRLEERGIVACREAPIPVGDIHARRVLYRLAPGVTWPGSMQP